MHARSHTHARARTLARSHVHTHATARSNRVHAHKLRDWQSEVRTRNRLEALTEVAHKVASSVDDLEEVCRLMSVQSKLLIQVSRLDPWPINHGP